MEAQFQGAPTTNTPNLTQPVKQSDLSHESKIMTSLDLRCSQLALGSRSCLRLNRVLQALVLGPWGAPTSNNLLAHGGRLGLLLPILVYYLTNHDTAFMW